MMSLRCRSCNSSFHNNRSLEIHFQYAHSIVENNSLPEPSSRSIDAPPDVESAESNNNNFFKYQNLPDNSNDSSIMTAISPGNQHHAADNREFQQLPLVHQHRNVMYDISGQQTYADNYSMLNSHQDYSRASPIIGQTSAAAAAPYTFNDQRYHPYYKHDFRELSRQPPHHQMPAQPPIPVRCDKCEFVSASQDLLLHHFNVAHGSIPALGIHSFNPRFGHSPANGGGDELQAEILDLDSHKVHVYQPPNGEDSQDSERNSSLDPWIQEDKKYFLQQQQQQQQQQLHITQLNGGGATNGRGGTPSAQISSSDNSSGGSGGGTGGGGRGGGGGGRSSSSKGNSKNSNGNWKSNEARRPKTYNCSACNKWFTSSGHLKRHYNTTLHKNAVKQSGAPDPAAMPVSAHHHPQKDPTYPSSRQMKNSSPISEAVAAAETTPPIKLENVFSSSVATAGRNSAPHSSSDVFLHGSPNLMAGPSDVPAGLLCHRTSYTPTPHDLIKSPSPISSHPQHSNPSNYLPFGAASTPPQQPSPHTLPPPFFQQHTPTTVYPNFQSPHVSTTHQVTTNRHTGNLTNVLAMTSAAHVDDCCSTCHDEDKTLPSFSCIQKNLCWHSQTLGLEQFLNTLEPGCNVGGSFTAKDVEAAASLLMKNYDAAIDKVKIEYKHVTASAVPTVAADDAPSTTVANAVDDTCGVVVVSSTTADSSPTSNSGSSAVGKGFSCEKCRKSFNKSCYLTQHNKSFHSGFKPYKCGRCGKRFTDTVQFKIHADKHAGDKPYKCDMCPKTFNHKTDLRRHGCLHTNVRPYTCDVCSKGFIRKDHMLKHRETHQNRKSVQRKFRVEKLKKELELEILC